MSASILACVEPRMVANSMSLQAEASKRVAHTLLTDYLIRRSGR